MPPSGPPSGNTASSSGYTALWQEANPLERDWIREIFGSLIQKTVVDGKYEAVLDEALVFDHFVTTRHLDYYSRFRGRNAVLVDLSDENYDFDPQIYVNFKGVIRPYWSDVFRPETIRILPLGYPAGQEVSPEEIRPSTARQYVWSFLGQVNKSSRPDMAFGLARLEPHLLFATDQVPGLYMWNRSPAGPRRYSKPENKAILLDSIFAPCPMGNVNLECFRIYECLQCGTIPILEKRGGFDYFRQLWGEHPVPTMSSWREAACWIGQMLERPAELDALQKRCTEWWQNYKQNYTASMASFLAERFASEATLRPQDLVYPKYFRPGWQIRELIRHHSANALLRRVRRQATRVLQTGRLRVASTSPDSGS